jgi:hypothetical protein
MMNKTTSAPEIPLWLLSLYIVIRTLVCHFIGLDSVPWESMGDLWWREWPQSNFELRVIWVPPVNHSTDNPLSCITLRDMVCLPSQHIITACLLLGFHLWLALA